jgi:hypothetical protein
MGLLDGDSYRQGLAVVVGFVSGLFLGILVRNLAFGLCLNVGLGAVIDGVMRLRAYRESIH